MPPDLPVKRLASSCGEIFNTCKSQTKQPGRSKTVDNIRKEEVYVTWNVRGMIDKEEELKYYNRNT